MWLDRNINIDGLIIDQNTSIIISKWIWLLNIISVLNILQMIYFELKVIFPIL